ncbi:MAG: hypothetical protein NXI24_22715 [bacterium]|nr:hypothetical protein [bacterium]
MLPPVIRKPRATIVPLIAAGYLLLNASCSAVHLNDDCVPEDPVCGGWALYLLGSLQVNAVYAISFGQRTATGQDWWLKKYSAGGVEDTLNWNLLFDGGNSGTDQPAAAVFVGDGALVIGGTDLGAGTGLDWALRKTSVAAEEDTVNWPKVFDGGNTIADQIFDAAATPDGGLIAVGKRSRLASADDWWIKKYAANGIEDTANWDKSIDGGNNLNEEANSVAVAADGSVFVVGTFNSPGSQKDWRIKKFSANGVEDTINWDKSFDGGGNLNDSAFAVAIAGDGGLYVAGDFNVAGPGPNMVIKKFSANGIEDTVNWNKNFDGGNNSVDAAIAMAVAPDGSLYVAGSATPSGKVDQDWWIKKFSAGGVEDTVNWNKQIDGGAIQNESAQTIQIAPDGSVFVGGSFGVAGGNSQAVVKKFSADGIEDMTNWNKIFQAEATGNNRVNHILLELGL